MSGTYVDNILYTGNLQFEKESDRCLRKQFDAKVKQFSPFSFTDIRCDGTP